MKAIFGFLARSLPIVVGLILSLVSLSFLVDFAASPSLGAMQDTEFLAFIGFG